MKRGRRGVNREVDNTEGAAARASAARPSERLGLPHAYDQDILLCSEWRQGNVPTCSVPLLPPAAWLSLASMPVLALPNSQELHGLAAPTHHGPPGPQVSSDERLSG